VFAPKHLLGFGGVDLFFKGIEGLAQIRGNVFATLGPFQEHTEVVNFLGQTVSKLDVIGEAALPLERFLRLFLVIPEIGGGDLLF
jgi:hypothetical protein